MLQILPGGWPAAVFPLPRKEWMLQISRPEPPGVRKMLQIPVLLLPILLGMLQIKRGMLQIPRYGPPLSRYLQQIKDGMLQINLDWQHILL